VSDLRDARRLTERKINVVFIQDALVVHQKFLELLIHVTELIGCLFAEIR